MKIQQHDGVVVDAAGIPAGLRQASAGGRGVARGKGGAKCKGAASLPPPPLYRPPGGPPLGDAISQGGRRPGGGVPPKASGGAPSPRVPNPRRRGAQGGGAPAHQGLVPLPLQPMGTSGMGGPTQWTPGTLPVVPVQYR